MPADDRIEIEEQAPMVIIKALGLRLQSISFDTVTEMRGGIWSRMHP
jgi:hypothetical protein